MLTLIPKYRCKYVSILLKYFKACISIIKKTVFKSIHKSIHLSIKKRKGETDLYDSWLGYSNVQFFGHLNNSIQ